MNSKKAYVLLFDGYADWEIGYVLPELRRLCKLEVVSAGFASKPVVSMGGLHVMPHTVISKVDLEDVQIFILPGGYMWERGYPESEVGELLCQLEQKYIPFAAICAATTAVARAGVLLGRKHTSNSLQYLTEKVPGYADSAHYVHSLAVRDRHVITASGLGAVEFAMEIFNELGSMSDDIKIMWFNAVKHGIYPENVGH